MSGSPDGATIKDYDSKTAAEKLDFLWTSIVADTHGDSYMNPLETLLKAADFLYPMAPSGAHTAALALYVSLLVAIDVTFQRATR